VFIHGRSAAIETVRLGWSRCALVGRVERVGGDGGDRVGVEGTIHIEYRKRFGLVWAADRSDQEVIRETVLHFRKINEE